MNLTQNILQSLEILQLPIMELRDFIMNELAENPAIDFAEEQGRETEEQGKIGGTPFPNSQKVVPNRKTIRDEETEKERAFQNLEERFKTLQDYVYTQFSVENISNDMKRIGEYIIYNLDDDGYLRHSIEEIAEALKPRFNALSKEALIIEIKKTLDVIQKLLPSGIGARDLKECLLLQLNRDDPSYSIKQKLITCYLEDIGSRHFSKISKELNITREELNKIIREISKLNPKPGYSVKTEKPIPIYPEVIVKEIDGKYEVIIYDSCLPNLTINKGFLSISKNKNISEQEATFIKEKVNRGKWLIKSIKQRKLTLSKIASSIVKYQTEFFEKGVEYLKPITMTQVADENKMHVSTVSRAISGKYIQTPKGIFSMKFFFTRPIDEKNQGAEQITRLAVLSKLQDIIDEEDKQNPIGDSKITELLNKMGVKVARRTVAKMREELKIPPARLRARN